jgi:MoaD family protein
MSATVRIPTPLRSFTGGADEVEVQGATVGEVLHDLAERYEGLGPRLLDEEGELRRFVNVFVGREDVRRLSGLETELTGGEVLSILPAVAGGRP